MEIKANIINLLQKNVIIHFDDGALSKNLSNCLKTLLSVLLLSITDFTEMENNLKNTLEGK